MSMRLYVGKLPDDIAEAELGEIFAKHGKVIRVTISKDSANGHSSDSALVEMEDVSEAQAAIRQLNGKQINGRAIVVNQARLRQTRPSYGH